MPPFEYSMRGAQIYFFRVGGAFCRLTNARNGRQGSSKVGARGHGEAVPAVVPRVESPCAAGALICPNVYEIDTVAPAPEIVTVPDAGLGTYP